MCSLNLPVTYGDSGLKVTSSKKTVDYNSLTRWIVSAMEGDNQQVQSYLDKLFKVK